MGNWLSGLVEKVLLPLTGVGLFVGAFETFKILYPPKEGSAQKPSHQVEADRERIIKFWVVVVAILFLPPFIDPILSLFIPFYGVLKLYVLYRVFWSAEMGTGWLFDIVDRYLYSKRVERFIKRVVGVSRRTRTLVSDWSCLWLHELSHALLHVCKGWLSTAQIEELIQSLSSDLSMLDQENKHRKRGTEKVSAFGRSPFSPSPPPGSAGVSSAAARIRDWTTATATASATAEPGAARSQYSSSTSSYRSEQLASPFRSSHRSRTHSDSSDSIERVGPAHKGTATVTGADDVVSYEM